MGVLECMDFTLGLIVQPVYRVLSIAALSFDSGIRLRSMLGLRRLIRVMLPST